MRVVGIDSCTSAILDRWLAVHHKRLAGRRAPVFCTLNGGRIEPSYIRHLPVTVLPGSVTQAAGGA
jgi:hypothetical protein